MTETKNPLIDDIEAGWQKAQKQLVELRRQVDRHTELAQAKLAADFLVRDVDKALHALGEAVWKQVSRGDLSLPPSLNSSIKAVREAQRQVEAQKAEIADLLIEGAEAVERRNARAKSGSKSEVASKTKKR